VRDPYNVLGISRDATLDEIKRAFRTRAKELHPDANPDDENAAERFKDASAAYEILTDPEKRAHYMRGDWDPWRDGDWGGAGGRSDDIVFDKEFGPGDREADLFGDIAGNRRGRGGTSMIIQGENMAEDLTVTFIEAAVGVRRRIELMTGPAIKLNVPPGIADGEVLRVPGYGFPGLGGAPPGDLNITVAVTPHEVLSRDTFDVRMDLEIAVDRLRDGDRIRVPTIGGEMAVEIPAGAEPGQVLRLRGMGIRDRVSGGRGDQYVRLVPADGSPVADSANP
jgi:DnaJ-class molecular chaperone